MARLGLLHAENVEMWGHHGHKALNINEGEKYLVDVKVWYDMEKQIEMDTVEDGISYYDIDDHIKETFDADHHTLLQPVARNMANSLVERCPLAQRVEVTIKKKFTIFPAILDYVAVTVTNDGVENPINRISLKNIRMWGVHGSAHEREIGEEYRVNIAVDYDMTRMFETDSFEGSLSITDVYRTISRVVGEEHYHMIQTIASRVADEVEKLDPTITRVEAKIMKPNVQIPSFLDWLSVTVVNEK
ncbi:MAG: dihydroneopterin aldolase [Clostridiales bacterium]|nr:dihydroneopterin aldolase [Clostridiales bacterium]